MLTYTERGKPCTNDFHLWFSLYSCSRVGYYGQHKGTLVTAVLGHCSLEVFYPKSFVLKKTLLLLLTTYFVVIATETLGATHSKKKYYSIQITALPLTQKKDGFKIYKKLKEKGYLVYYYKVKIKEYWWLRLRVGVFASIEKAQTFGDTFKLKEGLDFFVTNATVVVNVLNAEYEIVTTPSAIWLKKDSINKEIFQFSESKVETTDLFAYTRPTISPDGSKIVFKYESKVNTIYVTSEKMADEKGNSAERFTLEDSGQTARGDTDRAISDFSEAIKSNPANAKAYYNRGNVYQRKGYNDKAIADYNKSIAINPGLAEVYIKRGITFRRKGRYDKAISDYCKAIELDPDIAKAYYNRGVAYYIGKAEYEKAVSDFSRAIEISPGYAVAYINRGAAYHNKGQFDQAISDFDKAIEINPKDAKAYNNRGHAYFYKEQFDRAISDYNKTIAIDPGYADAYFGRGIAYLRTGQYDMAIFSFNKCLVINPENAKGYYHRGLTFFVKGDFDKSWDDIKKAQALGAQIAPEFIKTLKEASGRER